MMRQRNGLSLFNGVGRLTSGNYAAICLVVFAMAGLATSPGLGASQTGTFEGVLVRETCSGPRVQTRDEYQVSADQRMKFCRVLGFENQAGWRGHLLVGFGSKSTSETDGVSLIFRCKDESSLASLHQKRIEAKLETASKGGPRSIEIAEIRPAGGAWIGVSCRGKLR